MAVKAYEVLYNKFESEVIAVNVDPADIDGETIFATYPEARDHLVGKIQYWIDRATELRDAVRKRHVLTLRHRDDPLDAPTTPPPAAPNAESTDARPWRCLKCQNRGTVAEGKFTREFITHKRTGEPVKAPYFITICQCGEKNDVRRDKGE